MPEVRGIGLDELPHTRFRGSGRDKLPHIQGTVAVWAQKGREELLHAQGRRGDFVQGKEQWLHFAEAAMKRYPTSKAREPK